MSRSRYEPVPQRDEVINLESITSVPGYNYNSGIPNSVPSSVAPSIYNDGPHDAATSIGSIPVSPPPSFHTHSSPGTPRPTPSTHTTAHSQGDYAELWGVAASTNGAPTEACAGSEALATIAQLQKRITQLEETIGRLLIEKDEREPDEYKGNNCCMSFTDASPALERGISSSGGNTCIQFKKSKGSPIDQQQRDNERKHKMNLVVCVVMGLMACGTVVFIAAVKQHKD